MSNTGSHVCARCHEQQHGCCQIFSDTTQIFPLLHQESARLAQASGLEIEQFTVRDQITPQFKEILISLSPALAAAVPGNQRTRLKLHRSQCCFLGQDGCLLPEMARPYYCRLYPFWFMSDGRLLVLLSTSCLAQQKAANWRQVLERIGANEKELRALFDQYMRELASVCEPLPLHVYC